MVVGIVEGGVGPEVLATVTWMLLAIAAGDVVRHRRAYVEAIEERALRAEQSRETEAGRRVVEERLRIARELHDVVAHQITVINAHVGVASRFLVDDPVTARTSLDTVQSSASMVLDELGGLLRVLRSDDPATSPPAPTLVEVLSLVDSFRKLGLRVVAEIDTEMPACTEGVQLTIYRVVQEALTNAKRYGTGDVTLSVRREFTGVRIEVVKPIRPDGITVLGPGLGVMGMRERVAAVGGSFTAGPDPEGTFSMVATIPLPEGSA